MTRDKDLVTGGYQCFHCGTYGVYWSGDFSFEDYGMEGEGIINVCHCANCGADIEYYVPIEEEEEDKTAPTDERIKMVKAMEFISRNLNDEEIFYSWLGCGVADEDIKYGDLEVTPEDKEDLEYYLRDDNFAELMGLFIREMAAAQKSGGLYCDGVVSKGEEDGEIH